MTSFPVRFTHYSWMAALSAHSGFVGSRVYACLGVTCHLHFSQDDRGLLRTTAVSRAWNGNRIKSRDLPHVHDLQRLAPARGHDGILEVVGQSGAPSGRGEYWSGETTVVRKLFSSLENFQPTATPFGSPECPFKQRPEKGIAYNR